MPCKLAIPTMSLGHCSAGHSLETKLNAAQSYGYQGVEVCWEDLEAIANQNQCDDLPIPLPIAMPPIGPFPSRGQITAALKIRTMCQDRGIEIVCLQPFMQYEGLLNRLEHESRFSELLVWIKLAHILGTDMIMMPSSSLPQDQVNTDLDSIAEDFQKAADAGRREQPPIRFACESRCSATRIDRWEFCWDVIKKVDRPNFGMCLDTFHMAGLIFADPAVPSGRVPDGEKAVKMSMQRLVKRVKVHCDKVFLVQMGDARLPDEPIVPGSPDYDTEQGQRMVWSRKYRLFYGEQAHGAYLPIKEIAETIFNGIGFEGWVSLELFNSRMDCRDPNVPTELARRGAISWHKLANDMGWWPTFPAPNKGIV
ncbi:putative dehydroshikimate dehydratase [Annulohypoxylon stygium]|nr:putative dehydroshikimate dehydratase [Annulohypoxylon stygium]